MEHLSLKEKAYSIIKQKLLSMEYAPGGRIREDLLAAEIAISRTPVREAINKLIAEGFVHYVPRRGLFFITMQEAEIIELLDVREALEVLAVDKCVKKASPKEIALLEDILDRTARAMKAGNFNVCNELDSAFHLAIAGIAGNKKLIGFCRDIEDYMRIARAVEKGTNAPERNALALKEHLLILQCIRNKDRSGAVKAVRQNIRSLRTNLGFKGQAPGTAAGSPEDRGRPAKSGRKRGGRERRPEHIMSPGSGLETAARNKSHKSSPRLHAR